MRAAMLLLVAGFAATVLPGPWGSDHVTDLPIYSAYAESFRGGSLPYRDVAFEYPPLAAVLLALPGAAGDYEIGFGALALGLAATMVALVGALARRTGGDPRRAMLAAATLPLLLGALVRTRFDLAPVVLTLGGLLLLCTARPRAGLAVLGLGAATKLFPLLVAPVAVAWLLARGERRAAVEGTAALAIVLVATFGAAAALSPGGLGDSFAYHAERPVQVESAPAAVLTVLEAAGAEEPRPVHSHGSDGLLHPASDAIVGAFTVILALFLAGVALLVARGRPGERELVLGALLAVAALAAFGKVLSPQFMIWLVPLGALCLSWRLHAPALAIGGACLLTLAEFPGRYEELLGRDPATLVLVGARDALLVTAVCLCARALTRRAAPGPGREPARGSARSRWRARPRLPRPAPR